MDTGFRKRSCLTRELDRDDDSKKDHPDLGGETAGFPQIAQQREQRQPENHEVIALDALEQLDPEPLELIRPHARCDRRPGCGEIGIQERVRELPHRQSCDLAVLEQHAAVVHERDGAVQRVGLAAQRHELRARRRHVTRFGKPSLGQRQSLIGAQHQSSRQTLRDRPRLLARQQARNRRRVLRSGALLDATFIDVSWHDLERQPGIAQHRVAHRAFRRENERTIGKPQHHRSRHWLAAALGQQAHDRCRRLLDRATGHIDRRPVVARTKLARQRDLLSHRLAIDILIVVVMRVQPEQAILPDLHDALGTGIEADDQGLGQVLDMSRHRDAGHQRHIAGLHAAIGKIDRGGCLRGARHPYQHHIGFLEAFEMLAVVMQHRVVERVDSLEVLGIERVLRADAMRGLGPQVGPQQLQHGAEDRQARQA